MLEVAILVGGVGAATKPRKVAGRHGTSYIRIERRRGTTRCDRKRDRVSDRRGVVLIVDWSTRQVGVATFLLGERNLAQMKGANGRALRF